MEGDINILDETLSVGTIQLNPSEPTAQLKPIDTSLACLAMLARYHN